MNKKNTNTSFLKKLLKQGNYQTFNREIAKKLGLHKSIFISAILDFYDYRENIGNVDEEGFFTVSSEDMEKKSFLNRKSQDKCIKDLIACGLIIKKRIGLGALRAFKIPDDFYTVLKELLEDQNDPEDNQTGKNGQSDSPTETIRVAHRDNPLYNVNKNTSNPISDGADDTSHSVQAPAESSSEKGIEEVTPSPAPSSLNTLSFDAPSTPPVAPPDVQKKSPRKKSNFDAESYIREQSIEPEIQESLIEFLEVRRGKKVPNTKLAIDKLIKRLNDFSLEESLEAIDNTIINNWTSVYPKKKQQSKYQSKRQLTEKEEMEKMLRFYMGSEEYERAEMWNARGKKVGIETHKYETGEEFEQRVIDAENKLKNSEDDV